MPVVVGTPAILDRFPESVAPTFTWTSPTGRVTSLAAFGGTSGGVLVQPGAIGLGMPSYVFHERTSPAFDGASVRGHRADERTVALPLLIFGDSRAEFLVWWRRMVVDLQPRRRQPGTLTLTAPGGGSSTERTIEAFYAGGLDGNDDDHSTGMRHASVVLSLKCPSPYWLAETITARFQLAERASFYPYTWPLSVADSQVLGELTVENEGDAPTYPVFTITGPITSANLTNTTTGEIISVGGGLDAGDTLVIDTREDHRSVLVTNSLDEVTNRYADLTGDLWAFEQGTNQLALEMPGADVGSSLTIAYRPRYLTAY